MSPKYKVHCESKHIQSVTRGIFYSGTLVLLITVGGQFFGFLREVTFAKYFGTSSSFDGFTLVLCVVMFFSSIFSSIPFFLIPTLSDSLVHNNNKQFNTELSTLIFMIVSVGVSLVIILELFSGTLIHIIAPGFEGEKFLFTLHLFRISAPILTFLILAHLLRSLLNLNKIFFVPAFESLIFNIGIIFTVIIGWNFFNICSPLSIPFGYYLSYSVFLGVCMIIIFKTIKFTWHWNTNLLKKFTGGFLLVLFATFLNYLNPLVLMWHGSFLDEGAISGLGYVHRLLGFALGTVVNSFLVVFLPSASMQFHRSEWKELEKETGEIAVGFIIMSVFLVGFFFINSETIIRLLFQRGAFNEDSVQIVSGVLLFYIPWMITFPLSNLSSRMFYIQRDYKTLCFISAIGLLFTLIIAPFFRKFLGVNGLALTSSLHMSIYGALLLAVLYKRNLKLVSAHMGIAIVNLLLIGCVITFALWTIKHYAMIHPTLLLFVSCFILGIPSILMLNKHFNLRRLRLRKVFISSDE